MRRNLRAKVGISEPDALQVPQTIPSPVILSPGRAGVNSAKNLSGTTKRDSSRKIGAQNDSACRLQSF